MYDYIKGELTSKISNSKGNFVTVETGGVGYRFEVSLRDYNSLNSEQVKMYTVLIHREDRMFLCGFSHKEDRDIFNILLSVSGVGTKMALTLLDEFAPPELISFVIDNNYKALTSAKGVGPKLAQKIVLELKDKLINYTEQSPIVVENASVKDLSAIDDAVAVLISLGYSNDEIKNALKNISATLSENATAEEILKKSLQLLSV